MKELIELCEARQRARHVPHVVATVLRVEGSSYRRPGARMLIDAQGRVAGSISGGCLEKSVISQGWVALLDGRSRLLSFDTTDQDDLALGSSLGCQGKIWIGLEVLAAHQPWTLEEWVREICHCREPAVLVTRIHGGKTAGFDSTMVFSDFRERTSGPAEEALNEEIAEAFATGKTRFVGTETPGSTLIEWLGPPVALVLFGGGPDVPVMVKLAHELGHEITVIDRRPDFAMPERFPGAHRVIAAKPHQVRALLCPDERTVAVLMNHHYDTDRDVLAAILPVHLPYIAMLGPKRRTQRILDELRMEGSAISDEQERTIHGPAGLDIGAESPEQIALSILAEIQAVLAGREGGKLRRRNAPIYADAVSRREIPCALPA